MSEPAAARRHETLLEHREWVRSLARSLTRRAEDADDVEQQTWVAALSAAPPDEDVRSWRGWFSVVARNSARKLRRSEGRRRGREGGLAPGEAPQPASDLAERAEIHRRVVSAVLALREPYRETILLRYFEGLSVAATAARSGAQLETTRARLRRGKEMLRERLAAEFGVDRDWRLALGLLLEPASRMPAPVAAASAVAGGAIMGTKVAGLVALLTIAGAIAWSLAPERRPIPATRASGIDTAKVESPADRPRAQTTKPLAPAAEQPGAPPATAAPEKPRSKYAVGRPLRERLDDEIGTIEFPGEPVVESFGRLADVSEHPIVLSREAAAMLTSRADADRLRNAHLSFNAMISTRVALDALTRMNDLDYVVENERIVITPKDGKYDISHGAVELPHPAPHPTISFKGRVVDAQGAAVPGARIAHLLMREVAECRADASGAFEFPLRRPFGLLQAYKAGFVASVAVPIEPGAPDTVYMLAIGEPAGRLTVNVVADSGILLGASVRLGRGEPEALKLSGNRRVVRPIPEAWTGASGIVEFADLPAGRVPVVVSARGHSSAEREVDLVAGATAEVEVRLERLSPIEERAREKKVTLNVRDTDLQSVVKFLATASGINAFLEPELAARAGGTPITLELKAVSYADALAEVCQIVGAHVEYSGEIVWIRNGAKK